MKRPTAASLKKVTAENLAGLGAERLAEILVGVADARPELKRRLRMELAAAQGVEHLTVEIDKRLASLQKSQSKISWRQRPSFVADLDVLRILIVGRLAGLDRAVALNRLWVFMSLARALDARLRDKHGELAAVFAQAASDIGALLREGDQTRAADDFVEALVLDPHAWAEWLPAVLEGAPPELAHDALRLMSERRGAVPGWVRLVRRLADAANDVDAFKSTYSREALQTPSIAADVAQRLLAAGRVDEAGRLLQAAAPPKTNGKTAGGKAGAALDFDWETAWISYLDLSGKAEAAQAARWSSFERTLSVDRAKAFTSRLMNFEDVEAESRAFDYVAKHPDLQRALQFLMDWPALPEAGRLIQTRPGDVSISAEQAELWAARLRLRQPTAAHLLLRKAAATAFRRRDYATSDRLTREAEAIEVGDQA